MENYEIAFWKSAGYVFVFLFRLLFFVSVAVLSKIIIMENYEISFWKSVGYVFMFLLLFLVKSYGKLRNFLLKVCWLCFLCFWCCVCKIIWKTTKLLFENLLVMFLLLVLVKSYGKLRNCFWKSVGYVFVFLLLFRLLFWSSFSILAQRVCSKEISHC